MSGAPSPTFFRQAALDRLSDPEQLDRMLTVVRPADWIGYLGLLLVVASALAWSIFGTIATRVTGNGILVSEGGAIFAPVANSEGLVLELLIGPGQHVVAGQRLARIAQPDLAAQLATARAVADENRAQLADLGDQVGSYAAARARNVIAQRRLLGEQRRDAVVRAREIGEQLTVARGLLARGIVTRNKVSDLVQQFAAANQTVAEADGRLMTSDAEEIGARNVDRRDLGAAGVRLSETVRRVRTLQAELDRRQWVTSPIAGRVIEIKTPVGSRVDTGTPVVAVEQGAAVLQMIAYLPPRDGKLVRPGMTVNVAPSVAKREEYGMLTGRVTQVSAFPATVQAMQATLQNDQLVKDLSAGGAPIQARIRLDRGATPTGYAWTGGTGPTVPLTSGTLGTVEVTVERQPPIGFALPFLRRSIGQ